MIAVEDAREAVAEAGSVDAAAKLLQLPQKAFRRYCKEHDIKAERRLKEKRIYTSSSKVQTKGLVTTGIFKTQASEDVNDLFRQSGYNPDDLMIIKTDIERKSNINAADGVIIKATAYPTPASLGLKQAPPVRPFSFRQPKRKAKPGTLTAQWAVCSDLHFGQHENPLYAAGFIEMCRREQPTDIAIIGDLLDYAVLSSFTNLDSDTVNQCIQKAYKWLLALRAAVPADTRIHYLQGNHEVRMQKGLVKDAPAFREVFRGGETVSVLSERFLLRFDDPMINIKEHGVNYPDGKIWVCDDLALIHGVAIGPQAAKKTIESKTYSVMFGHTHAATSVILTSYGRYGQTIRQAINIGHGSMNTGHGYCDDPENWVNGGAIINVHGNDWSVSPVKHVNNNDLSFGKMFYNDKILLVDTPFTF